MSIQTSALATSSTSALSTRASEAAAVAARRPAAPRGRAARHEPPRAAPPVGPATARTRRHSSDWLSQAHPGAGTDAHAIRDRSLSGPPASWPGAASISDTLEGMSVAAERVDYFQSVAVEAGRWFE